MIFYHHLQEHMANSMAIDIPQDIIYQVIAAVDDDEKLLKQCALVSSSFLIPSRKQLFSEICLRGDKAAQRLYQCLIQNPVIQSFVRSIDIRPRTASLLINTSLFAILRLPFCHLESFSMRTWTWYPSNWNNLSNELKDALSNIIHSSSLKTLYLNSLANVPINLFLGIAHLTKLELDSILPGDFCMQSSSLTLAASKGVATTVSPIVIDQCVWSFSKGVRGMGFPTPAYFSLTWDMPVKDPTESIFLPFMCHLRYFEINVNPHSTNLNDCNILSGLIHSLCVSLASPATLEHLKLNIWYRHLFPLKLCNADIWNHLDSIIALPIGSRLQRVDIDITFPCDEDMDNDHVLRAVLDGVPFQLG